MRKVKLNNLINDAPVAELNTITLDGPWKFQGKAYRAGDTVKVNAAGAQLLWKAGLVRAIKFDSPVRRCGAPISNDFNES
jgi:hypothetical protein